MDNCECISSAKQQEVWFEVGAWLIVWKGKKAATVRGLCDKAESRVLDGSFLPWREKNWQGSESRFLVVRTDRHGNIRKVRKITDGKYDGLEFPDISNVKGENSLETIGGDLHKDLPVSGWWRRTGWQIKSAYVQCYNSKRLSSEANYSRLVYREYRIIKGLHIV